MSDQDISIALELPHVKDENAPMDSSKKRKKYIAPTLDTYQERLIRNSCHVVDCRDPKCDLIHLQEGEEEQKAADGDISGGGVVDILQGGVNDMLLSDETPQQPKKKQRVPNENITDAAGGEGSDGAKKDEKDKVIRYHFCVERGCFYSTPLKQNFVRHVSTHTGVKPFKCSQEGCGYACNQASNLKKHMRVHSGDRPFKCETCKSSFRQSEHLRIHKVRCKGEGYVNKKEIGDNMTFTCDACPYTCRSKRSLTTHKRKCQQAIIET